MTIRILHLFPQQLGLNGEGGNISVCKQRLEWAGISSDVFAYQSGSLPSSISAVMIGSGTFAGAMSALEACAPIADELAHLRRSGVPFFAFGLGWEILGEKITTTSGDEIKGLGIFPTASLRVEQRASCESYGEDRFGNLTAGYSNHAAEISLHQGEPLVKLEAGFGNSSTKSATESPGEGYCLDGLRALRINGPALALNPHLADEFLEIVCQRQEMNYVQNHPMAREADSYAQNAREELKARLAR